jgi:sialic acid synthase SpsE
MEIKLGNKLVGENHPPYYIADIAANHDGDISRAKDLVWIAKEAGADCAKFQHFLADKIVNDVEFAKIESLQTHQSTWKKSVAKIYDDYHFRREWTEIIYNECLKAEIEFSTSPYDYEAVKQVNEYVNYYKIGSGDISWCDFVEFVASKGKPIIVATGASDLDDVDRIVNRLQGNDLVLMQCNTNYTLEEDKHFYTNIKVLEEYSLRYKNIVLGLSDHTLTHGSTLGAIALGARVIEKHFTDDNNREGPDHKFALNPKSWKEMVEMGNEVFECLGDGRKKVEENEKNAYVVQRRSIVCVNNLEKGHTLTEEDLDFLRPCPKGSFHPYQWKELIGKTLNKAKLSKESILKDDLC